MPLFHYTAADQGGKIVTGKKEAENDRVLAQTLKANGLFLLEAKNAEGRERLKAWNISIDVRQFLNRVLPIRLMDKMFFARNLSVMVAAGISLTRALEGLAEESASPKMKKVIMDVNDSVVKGKSFADALRAHPKVFSEFFINMIEVGEATGKLVIVLRLLASQMRKDYLIRKRVHGAMIYPAIILVALVLVTTLMMIYVIPTLSKTIKELGVPLPLTTQIVIGVSDFLTRYILWVLAGAFLLSALFWRMVKTKIGRNLFDRLTLKLPIFGPLLRKFNLARFSRTLAYLISAGVPIVRSLEITASILGNMLYRQTVIESASEIQKGKPLNEILKPHHEIFPPLIIQMIQVGEETGKISSMLLRLALFFEDDVASTTKNLSSTIEPILMIVIGIIVGFFAVSMLQPIYSSLGNI
jgi:type IV pilus assembly protein PilC